MWFTHRTNWAFHARPLCPLPIKFQKWTKKWTKWTKKVDTGQSRQSGQYGRKT